MTAEQRAREVLAEEHGCRYSGGAAAIRRGEVAAGLRFLNNPRHHPSQLEEG